MKVKQQMWKTYSNKTKRQAWSTNQQVLLTTPFLSAVSESRHQQFCFDSENMICRANAKTIQDTLSNCLQKYGFFQRVPTRKSGYQSFAVWRRKKNQVLQNDFFRIFLIPVFGTAPVAGLKPGASDAVDEAAGLKSFTYSVMNCHRCIMRHLQMLISYLRPVPLLSVAENWPRVQCNVGYFF
jgi:hypothetical protein